MFPARLLVGLIVSILPVLSQDLSTGTITPTFDVITIDSSRILLLNVNTMLALTFTAVASSAGTIEERANSLGAAEANKVAISSGEGSLGSTPGAPNKINSRAVRIAESAFVESITTEAVGFLPVTTVGVVFISHEKVIASGESWIVWYPFYEGAASAP